MNFKIIFGVFYAIKICIFLSIIFYEKKNIRYFYSRIDYLSHFNNLRYISWKVIWSIKVYIYIEGCKFFIKRSEINDIV
jgi:hypothetical protein